MKFFLYRNFSEDRIPLPIPELHAFGFQYEKTPSMYRIENNHRLVLFVWSMQITFAWSTRIS